MFNFTLIRAAVVTTAFAAMTLAGGPNQRPFFIKNSQPVSVITQEDSSEPLFDNGESAASPGKVPGTSTFYALRPDLRRCVSPLCGGYFVKSVNMSLTRCSDGRYLAECYVAEIDWNGQPEVEAGKALLRGSLVARRHGKFGNLGALSVTESWQAASDKKPDGTFYRVRDRGVRCITLPCPTHSEAKLSSTIRRNIAGADLTGAGADDDRVSEAFAAMTGPEGVIVAGNHVRVTGPAGTMDTLKATQFYLLAGKKVGVRPPVSKPTIGKPCIKTGCGNTVCADHTVFSTCEWRPEYACYQKARCERQSDGNCGFTRTRALAACLSAKRRR